MLSSGNLLLAAESNTWATAFEQLRNSFDFQLWGGLLTTLAAVWWLSAIYLRHRANTPRKIDNPPRLFRELCKAQRLGWNETALVEQLAEARELEDPALLFVRDDYWTVDDLNGALDEHAAAIAKMREKLFAQTEQELRDAEAPTAEPPADAEPPTDAEQQETATAV